MTTIDNYEYAKIIIVDSDGEENDYDEYEKKKQLKLTEYFYISHGLMFKYFVGYEITSLLGYKNIKSAITHSVSKQHQLVFRDYPGVKNPPLNPRTILITTEGVTEILLKTRKILTPDVLHLFKEFGIQTTNMKCLSKEQRTLHSITNVLKIEKHEGQVKINKDNKIYYLDLYFSDYRIIVECDENGHNDRRPSDERKRMDDVNEVLDIDDTHWVRFNPDAHDFDISRVTGQIYRKMKEKGKYVKKYIMPTKYKMNINLDPEKPCTKCGVVKLLKEFNNARDHRDGKENVCIICRRDRQEDILREKKKKIAEIGLTEIKCNICEDTLPLDNFYRDKCSPTGRMRRCKVCHKIRLKKISEKPKISITEKKCTQCKLVKSVSEFHKASVSPDGYKIYCKKCIRRK